MTELVGSDPAEVPLSGGNTSAVVRVGETVRRSTGHWTPAVHGVLRHLEHAGFEGSPRVLGHDDRGREVLTYLPGHSAYGAPWPSRFWSDSTLVQVGRLLRRYHEAVRDYRPRPDSRWWYTDGAPAADEIICHNDAAPYNTVLDGDRVVGFIDWDIAGPAVPRWDLAFAAWSWVPLHHPALARQLGGPGARSQAQRLALLCSAYGDAEPVEALLPLIRDRVAASRDGIRDGVVEGNPIMIKLRDQGHLDDIEMTLAYLGSRIPRLTSTMRQQVAPGAVRT